VWEYERKKESDVTTPREVLQRILHDEHAAELVVALVGSSVQTAQQAHNLEARVRAENDLLLVALEAGRYFRSLASE
jgi:hypothetical protein